MFHYVSHPNNTIYLLGTFEIGLPNCASRLQILELFLKKQSMTKGARDMIPKLAKDRLSC